MRRSADRVWRPRQVAADGARAAIDDFGAGQTSLPPLRRLPIDSLQLDRQFVTEIGVYREATTVAQLEIGLAHVFGPRVAAAGVERKGQVEQLTSLGWEYAQGNFFCTLVPGPELLPFLIRNKQRTRGRPRTADPPNIRRLNV